MEYHVGEVVNVHMPYRVNSLPGAGITKGLHTITNVSGDWIKLRGVDYPVHCNSLFRVSEGYLLHQGES